MLNTTPRLEGMHAATASTTGWLEATAGGGPDCFFCGDPARRYLPVDGLLELASYEVRTTTELEDLERKRGWVYAL